MKLPSGKTLDQSSVRVDGIRRDDYPDFCDAYAEEASYEDGEPLSDSDRRWLERTDFFYTLVIETFHNQ
jgi:hypothetical protein